jgi:hypothetical protein
MIAAPINRVSSRLDIFGSLHLVFLFQLCHYGSWLGDRQRWARTAPVIIYVSWEALMPAAKKAVKKKAVAKKKAPVKKAAAKKKK